MGELDAPVVVTVHGFASGARDNWVLTGWVRELTRAGYRVLALDQRGHGQSDKPHESDAYAIRNLVTDVETVMDTYLVDDAFYLGYSLGARVGWEVARELPHRIGRAVLGGVPDGIPSRVSTSTRCARTSRTAPRWRTARRRTTSR